MNKMGLDLNFGMHENNRITLHNREQEYPRTGVWGEVACSTGGQHEENQEAGEKTGRVWVLCGENC